MADIEAMRAQVAQLRAIKAARAVGPGRPFIGAYKHEALARIHASRAGRVCH
jgi:hypothetical protein